MVTHRLSNHFAHRACLSGILLFTASIAFAAPADHFVTTWDTNNPGSSGNTSITVPMVGGPYDVDWNNDGVFDQTGLSSPVTHDFGTVGTYTIRIGGAYDSIRFSGGGDVHKLLSVDQWGTKAWQTMDAAFQGGSNLEILATDVPGCCSQH